MATLTQTIAALPTQNSIRWLALTHFANDFFSGAIGILLASQADELRLSKEQIGTASAIFLTVSLLQPLIGWAADFTRRPVIMMTGPFWTTLGLAICALAQSYPVIVLGALLGGFGNAMFHPIGLASARVFGRDRGKGRSVALFMFGGNSGFAVGPFIAGFALKSLGPDGILPFALVNAIMIPLLVLRLAPYMHNTISTTSRAAQISNEVDVPPARRWYQSIAMLIALYLIIVLFRSMLNQALAVFLPTFYKEQGYGLDFAGVATAIFLIASAAGSYIGASLSDRYSRTVIVFTTLALITPFAWLMIHVESIVGIIIFSILTGLVINANWPILLMIGQEVFPGGTHGAAGLAFGWGFVSNAAGSFVAGVLADRIGLQDTLQWMALLPLAAAFLMLGLRHPHTS